jgi:transposase
VGAVVALTFKSTIDDPARFGRSRSIGPYLGLVPRRYQSGETDHGGSITRIGDVMLRTALYEAATTILRMPRRSALRAWALRLAERAGVRKARVALARKLGVVLHRMWASGSAFRWEAAVTV